MANGVINLILKSASVGSGFEDVRKQTKNLLADTNDLSAAAKKLGPAFGNAGNIMGRAIGDFLKGGIWRLAAMAVEGAKFLIGLCAFSPGEEVPP